MRMFVCFPALMFLVISSTNSISWVSHDLLLWKPCCSGYSSILIAINDIISCYEIRLITCTFVYHTSGVAVEHILSPKNAMTYWDSILRTLTLYANSKIYQESKYIYIWQQRQSWDSQQTIWQHLHWWKPRTDTTTWKLLSTIYRPTQYNRERSLHITEERQTNQTRYQQGY